MRVVLFQPEIPQNVGNIARTCSATGTPLTLVRPLSFSLSGKQLKRAGLDYWDELDLSVVDAYECDEKCCFLSTKGTRLYTEIPFSEKTVLIFGSESSGVAPEYHEKYQGQFYRIPMLPNARSLNLANTVALTLYEGLRQLSFQNFETLLQYSKNR